MNKYLLLPLLLPLVLYSACTTSATKWERLPAQEERVYPLSGFNRVVLSVPAELKIRQAGDFSLKGVSKYKGALDHISLSVKEETLYIAWKEDEPLLQSRNYPKVEYFLTLPELVQADLRGSGDIDLLGSFTGEAMNFNLQGSGDFEVQRLELKGALSINLTGSGDFDFKHITAQSASVNLQGSGDIEGERLESEGALDSNLRGSGTIKIKELSAEIMHHYLQGSGDFKLTNIKFVEENLMELVGSGDFAVNDCLGDGKTTLRLRGSGDMRIANLRTETLNAELVMSGTMRILAGSVETLAASLEGSGDILFKELKAARARVWRKGSGDMELYVTDKLYIDEASGSGSLRYAGSPTIMVKK